VRTALDVGWCRCGMYFPCLRRELPLKGPKGERVDLLRTFLSHGVADLPSELSPPPRAADRHTLLLRGRPGTTAIASEVVRARAELSSLVARVQEPAGVD
jgi:hypothetical protein